MTCWSEYEAATEEDHTFLLHRLAEEGDRDRFLRQTMRTRKDIDERILHGLLHASIYSRNIELVRWFTREKAIQFCSRGCIKTAIQTSDFKLVRYVTQTCWNVEEEDAEITPYFGSRSRGIATWKAIRANNVKLLKYLKKNNLFETALSAIHVRYKNYSDDYVNSLDSLEAIRCIRPWLRHSDQGTNGFLDMLCCSMIHRQWTTHEMLVFISNEVPELEVASYLRQAAYFFLSCGLRYTNEQVVQQAWTQCCEDATIDPKTFFSAMLLIDRIGGKERANALFSDVERYGLATLSPNVRRIMTKYIKK